MKFTVRESVTTEEKLDLIGQTIYESFVESIINPFLLDVLFKVNLFLTFTENDITLEQKQDKITLYDEIIKEYDSFVKEMSKNYPEDEKDLYAYTLAWSKKIEDYNNSWNGMIDGLKVFMEKMGKDLEGTLQDFKGIDFNKILELLPVADQMGANIDKSKNI